MSADLIQRQTTISGHLVQFCRFLRKHGFILSHREESDAMASIGYIPIHQKTLFKSALKATLAKNHWQRIQFDDLYDEFWKQIEKAANAKIKEEPESQQKKDQNKPASVPSFDALKDWLYHESPQEEEEMSAFSDIEVYTRKDFAQMSEDELRLISSFLKKMVRKMAHQKSRLKRRSKHTSRLDLRRTFSANLRRGGEIQKLVFSEPKDKKLKLVLLCDVSKSMDLYSRFFMHMIYAFQSAYDKIETFVFSTAIHRISELLENHDFDKAYEIIAQRVPQWSGGTKIGTCLQSFYDNDGIRMLNKKTIVFIVSDGWDTGEQDTMEYAMKSIYKQSKKVIWLNPLAGNPNFSADVTGLQVAMPYIDVFQSAHNLESLKEAMYHLKSGRRKTYSTG